MLNAKSGLVDFLKPSTGMKADKRQGSTGQMKQRADGHETPAQATKSPAASAAPAQDNAAPQADNAESDSTGAEQALAQESGGDSASQPEEEALAVAAVAQPVVELPPQMLEAEGEELPEAAAESEGDAALINAASGKELPVLVPMVAAETDEEAGVSRWLKTQGLVRAGSKLTAAAELPQAAGTESESADSPALEDDFLHGLRAAMGQRGAEGETPLGAGMGGKGQGEDALLKLAGMATAREAVLGAAGNAVSTPATAAANPPPAGASQMPQLLLDAPLRQPGWDHAFAERIVWLARQGLQQAEIQLNPRHLGPIEVHVAVDKDQASVTFITQHAVTREALEAALPRLRDMLQGNGLNLAQSEVSQHSFGQQQRETMGFAGDGQGRRGHEGGDPAEQGEAVRAETVLESGRGLSAVDYYA